MRLQNIVSLAHKTHVALLTCHTCAHPMLSSNGPQSHLHQCPKLPLASETQKPRLQTLEGWSRTVDRGKGIFQSWLLNLKSCSDIICITDGQKQFSSTAPFVPFNVGVKSTMMFVGHLRHTKFLAAAKKLVLKHHMLMCESFCRLVVE